MQAKEIPGVFALLAMLILAGICSEIGRLFTGKRETL